MPADGRRKAPGRWNRRRTVVVELAVAALVLVAVAATATTSSPGDRAAINTDRAAWTERATPAVTALVGDLSAVRPGAGTVADAAVAHLARDVSTARGIGSPPTAALASTWTATLSELDRTLALLRGEGAHPSPATVTAIDSGLEGAIQDLLAVSRLGAAG